VSLTGRGRELRLLIRAETSLRPTLSDRGGDLVLRFGEGVYLSPPYTGRKIGGALLSELVFEHEAEGTQLRIVTGPGFRSANLRKPRQGAKRAELVLRGDPRAVAAPVTGPADEETGGVHRVVIDPGHGGSEEGAKSPAGLLEKTITLQVAGLLQRELEGRADVFISLHANASPRLSARGAETYFLAREATDDEARTTAALENDAARLGDRNEPEGLELVLWDLAQVEYLEESAALAGAIQKELNAALDLRDRGVRQAPFRVLMGATMPAVLVEMGFLTHHEEGRLLGDVRHQERLAKAIARALETFRRSYDRRLGVESRESGSRR
jgi:N-acetylmuramoyl-L-alanine amidase